MATVTFLDVIITPGGIRAHLICLFALPMVADLAFWFGTHAFRVDVAEITSDEKSCATVTTRNNWEEVPARARPHDHVIVTVPTEM